MFVAIEGGDGAGKSTVCDVLAARQHRDWIFTHEPCSKVPLGKLVQDILDGKMQVPAPAMLGLFTAARLQHLSYLDDLLASRHLTWEKATVVCDRYIGSTMVYQQSHWPLTGVIVPSQMHCRLPDLGIYLRIAPALASERNPDRYPHLGNLEVIHQRYEELFTGEKKWPHLGHRQIIVPVIEKSTPETLADSIESAIEGSRPARKPGSKLSGC